MPNANEPLAVTIAIAVALAVVTLAVITAGLIGRPVAGGAAGLPSCAEWTDGCVVCARQPEGLACSMPGIACVRGPVQCLKP